MRKRLCALYIRVSTLRQAGVEDGSLKTQESNIRTYLDFKNTGKSEKWQIAGIYREEGRSGKDLNRPEFQRMMIDIKKGKINTVIITKIDRLTRSIKDFSSLWDNFQNNDVQVISLNENFDTTNPMGRAMLSIVLVFAQLEREQTGERTAATMQYRAEQGLWNGGRIIGYDLDPDEKGILKINNEQADIVKKAFMLCTKTGSAGQAHKKLNELGYRVPVYESRRGNHHGGKLFTKQTILKMLQNPVYLGQITWNGKQYKGRHQAIVDEKTFSKVQELLNHNRRTRSNQSFPSEHVYLLQGVLTCGKCGSSMTPKSGIGRSSRYYYYQCTMNARTGEMGCNTRYIPAEPIENFVLDRVKQLTTSEAEISKITTRANKNCDHRIDALKTEKRTVAGNLQEVKNKIDQIVLLIESGSLKAFDSLNKRIEALESDRVAAESRLKAIDFEVAEVEKQILSAQIMSQSFKTFRDIIEKARPQKLKELLSRIIDVVEWHENENDKSAGHCKISYFEQPNLKLPTKKLSEPDESRFAECQDWLPE